MPIRKIHDNSKIKTRFWQRDNSV